MTTKTPVHRKLCYLLVLPVLISGFNMLVNPYDQWPLPRIDNFNDKITETSWDPFIKNYQIQRNRYDTLILGSSRAAIALDHQHQAFSEQNVYNFGLSGAGITLQSLSLKQAATQQPIKHVILATDFFGFNAHSKLNQPALHGHKGVERLFNRSSLTDHILGSTQVLGDTFSNTLGWRGTNSSIRTLITQNTKTVYIDSQGQWRRFGTKSRNYQKQYKRTEQVFLTDLLFPLPRKEFSFTDTNTGFNSFTIYRQLLTFAHDHDIKLTIIILPTPLRDLFALKAMGLWPHYKQWKKQIVSLNNEVAYSNKHKAFDIWDFEDSQDHIASDSLTNLKPYFHEPFHPTPLVGEQILNRVFLDCDQYTCWPGVRLTTQTVNDALFSLEHAIDIFPQQFPQQHKDVNQNIQKAMSYLN